MTPVFYQMLERIGGHVIIEVDVGGPGQWKDPTSPAPPRTVQAQERAHTSKVGTRRYAGFQNRQVGAQQHPEGRPVLREDLYGDEALRRQTPSLYNMHFSSRPTPRDSDAHL